MKKGFVSIIILLGIAFIVLIAGVVIYQKIIAPKVNPTPTPTISPSPIPNPTANWKTYTNNQNGFSIKYPTGANVVNEEITLNPDNPKGDYFKLWFESQIKPSNQKLDTFATANSPIKPVPTLESKIIGGINSLTAVYFGTNKTYIAFIPNGGNNKVIIIQAWINNDNKTYTEAKFFDQILSTFKFLD